MMHAGSPSKTPRPRFGANKPDLSSFEARLNFGQAFVEARLTALKAENPKLIAFYNSLDTRQKEKFDRFRERHGRE